MKPIDYHRLIAVKKQGRAFTREEAFAFIKSVREERWPDYQIASLLMAVRLVGMDSRETLWFTQAMARYSRHLDGSLGRFAVDKHSTGGVGDSISLVLAPLAASLGIVVPMMSGRSLGLTGGTLDKLEAIPGFHSRLKFGEISRQLKRVRLAMFGQTKELAPVDRKLYALRDAIGAVDVPGLVVSSILSKKLVENIDGIVFDVKCGRGAIFKNPSQAADLARSLVKTARQCGLKSRALLTYMEEPLGRAVGDSVEVHQAWEFLRPGSDLQKDNWESIWDFRDLTFALLHKMLQLSGRTRKSAEAENLARKALKDGSALKKFQEMMTAQGVARAVAQNLPKHLPRPKKIIRIVGEKSGFVSFVDAKKIALASLSLGALRKCREDRVDHAAGIVLIKKRGDSVRRGEILAELHASSASIQDCKIAASLAKEAVCVSRKKPPRRKVITRVIG